MRHSVTKTRGCHQSAFSGEATSRQLEEQKNKLSSWDTLFPHCIGWFSKSSPSSVTSLEVNLKVLIPLFQVLPGSVVVDVQVLLLLDIFFTQLEHLHYINLSSAIPIFNIQKSFGYYSMRLCYRCCCKQMTTPTFMDPH